MITNLNLTDMETCYKVFRREVIQSIPLEENRFGFEPEVTVKIAKRNLRVYEVGISYWGARTQKARKSAGKTASAPCGAWRNTGSRNQRSPKPLQLSELGCDAKIQFSALSASFSLRPVW